MLVPLAFCISAVLSGVLVVLLHRAGVLDVPNGRSSHATPTPRGGGLAVMVGIVVALAVAGNDVDWILIGAASLLSLVGLADDLRSLPAYVRLALQVVVVALFALNLSNQSDALGPVFLAIGMVAVVAYINAFNFMDGVNGISALQAVLAGGWGVWLGAEYQLPGVLAVGTAVVGAALGFLPWNARGRIFLGDVGSYGIGALIALLTLAAWADGVPWLVAVAPLVVYLADTGWVLIKRSWAGESVTSPHRDHVYQRLVRQGWSHLTSASWVTIVATACCLVVVFVWDSAPKLVPVLLGGIGAIYLSTPRMLRRLLGSDGATP